MHRKKARHRFWRRMRIYIIRSRMDENGQDNDGMRKTARRIPTRSPRYLENIFKINSNAI
jgi:hypothetical protein